MKKALLSLIVITAVAGIAYFGYSKAFFSDTETSAGNTLVAGEIDLKIDNHSYIDQTGNGLVESAETTWRVDDLDNEHLFFDFTDLKPGDLGEDTISLHVSSNSAWVCADVDLTVNSDESCTEPEQEDESNLCVVETDGTNGDLAQALNFIFWQDDGDNVLESSEAEGILTQGPASGVLDGATWSLFDSQTGNGLPTDPEQVYFIGKAWCFGDLTVTPVAQDDLPGQPTNGPDVRTAGVTCSGELVNNVAQTDKIMADVTFRAVQARHNEEFVCRPLDQGLKVGANLSLYQAPTCDITVNPNNTSLDTIQEAVNSAGQNQTVCVPDGTYNETVDIEIVGLTLASLNGPSNTATITGGVLIGVDGVTVKGFIVNPGSILGENASFYINGSRSNIVIRDNDINGLDESLSRGVVVTTGSTYSNVLVSNNKIHDLSTGVYTNPHTGSLDITLNDINDNGAGIGGITGAHVTYNHFNSVVAGDEAIGADSSYDGSVVDFNNFLNGTRINDYGAVALISAENNFFNTGGVNQTTVGQVDFTPEAVAQYLHN